MTTSAKFFLTLFSASLLLTACQSKSEQTAKPASSSQPSSSAIVTKQPTTSSSVAAGQEEVEVSSEVSDDIVEDLVEEPEAEAVESVEIPETATIIPMPEQLVGTWEVFYPEYNFKYILTYGADGSVVKTSLDLDTGETYTWNSTIGLFYDMGNGAVRFDNLGGDWHTVAQTGLGGGPGAIHTGVVFHEDGTIATKVWQFGAHIAPADYTYPTDGGVRMTRVE